LNNSDNSVAQNLKSVTSFVDFDTEASKVLTFSLHVPLITTAHLKTMPGPRNKLAMDQLHYKTYFHKTSNKTALSQQSAY
jgi:hypothetical protein